MNPFIEQAQRYSAVHKNHVTLYTHMAGIPLIAFSLIIFFGFLHLTIPGVLDIKFADLMVLALLVYYFRLNWILALILTPVFLIMLWLADFINHSGPTSFALLSFVIIFLIGCGFQLAGHILQGNKPAFLQHPIDSIAAPMFILAEALFMAGWMKSLQSEICPDEKIDHEKNVKKKK